MYKPTFHTYRLFLNLDPLQVGYEDQLVKEGRVVATLHSEYVVKRLEQKDAVLSIVLRKVWTGGNGQPVGGVLILKFEGATVMPAPGNDGDEVFQKVHELRDIRPYDIPEANKAKGFKRAVELSTDQGLWEVFFREAYAFFDPEV